MSLPHFNCVDITGKKFGLLTAVKVTQEKSGAQYKWLYECVCGNTVIRNPSNVRQSRDGANCGCTVSRKRLEFYNRESTSVKTLHPLTHGSWRAMKERCNNPNNHAYKYYGERGIKICERWLSKDGFANFLEDMGERPSSNYSLDRIDVNGNYSPENCKWATPQEQAENTTANRWIEHNGETLTLQAFLVKNKIAVSSFYKLLSILSGDYQKTADYILENRGSRSYLINAKGIA